MNWKEKYEENKRRITEGRKPTDVKCKKFGCGKVLTHTEYLYSDYCFKHATQFKFHKNKL
jgi:hypothetical protein